MQRRKTEAGGPMIIFNNVDMSFKDTVVMDKFCAEYEANKINCILGPSGCGKTTLLNLISGIIMENGGQVTKPERVSYVFQDESLIPQKTARKNLEFALKSAYKDKAELSAAIDNLLELSGLGNASDLYPHEMSGGMRQRLALIRAFGYPSDVLLMDEPFKALDITLRDSIIKSFMNLYENDKRTVIFVTHNIDEALLTGDYVFVYSKKPINLQKRFIINKSRSGRKLYDDSLAGIKNEILRETEKWQT